MKKRLFSTTVAICILGLVLMFCGSLAITAGQNYTNAKERVVGYNDILARQYSSQKDPQKFVENGINEMRVSVINSDGKVIADSDEDASMMDNHLGREEVINAIVDTPKVVVRRSDSQAIDLMYYAKKVATDEGFVIIRCSIKVASINGFLLSSLPLFILILAMVVTLAVVLSKYMSKKMLVPLAEVKTSLSQITRGEFLQRSGIHPYEEVNSLMVEIDDIGQRVQQNIASLTEEKNKSEYILNAIGDGILAVDKDCEIILLNERAAEIFDTKPTINGKKLKYLTADKKFLKIVNDSFEGKEDSVVEYSREGSDYLLATKCLAKDWKKEGKSIVVIILQDVTIAKNAAKLREQFFENASHELKTPLTTVKGFAELLKKENKNTALDPFIGQILNEADRMVALILDMLKLSELEKRQGVFDKEKVNLQDVAQDVKSTLQAQIDEKQIEFSIEGNGSVLAVEKDIFGLMKNLVENAVKYNNQNGFVKVEIIEADEHIRLRVTDNGVGIGVANQARIFERFYRVSESRSRTSGGTGLGLSIVKHICGLYGAKLTLKSRANQGTEISVVFKRA